MDASGACLPIGCCLFCNDVLVTSVVIRREVLNWITRLLQDYARRRSAFGALLCEQPLALRTLAWLELHTCACTVLALEAARLLGEPDCGWTDG